MKNKSWDEFWAEFLQVRFHAENPELWPSRQKKALWFQKICDLKSGMRVLDLGCGDGLIDVWLSRMGMNVVAVDRNKKVLEVAKTVDDTEKVEFITSELKDVAFKPASFDAILFIETLGLANKNDDFEMFLKAHVWVKPNGFLIVDCPQTAENANSWSKEFPEGTIRGESTFDMDSRIQNIQFYFKPHGQEEFGLVGSANDLAGSKPGIIRYLYPKTEMIDLLSKAGFKVFETEHYYPKDYYSLKAVKQ